MSHFKTRPSSHRVQFEKPQRRQSAAIWELPSAHECPSSFALVERKWQTPSVGRRRSIEWQILESDEMVWFHQPQGGLNPRFLTGPEIFGRAAVSIPNFRKDVLPVHEWVPPYRSKNQACRPSCVCQCKWLFGHAVNWPLVQGVSPPSHNDGWWRRQ